MNLDYEKSKFSGKHGDYKIGKVIALADPSLHSRAQEYKRHISGAMKALSGQDIARVPKGRGFFVTRKYDGEFALLAFDGEKLLSVNPGGTVRVGLPAFEEAERLLIKAKVKECLLAAEIYLMGDTTKINRVSSVVGILRSPSSKAELDKLGVAVFDIVELDGEPVPTAAGVFETLKKIFGKGKLVHPAEYAVANSVDKIMEIFTDWVIGEGSEGLVVRHDNAGYYKIKTKHNLDVAIIGFSEGFFKTSFEHL